MYRALEVEGDIFQVLKEGQYVQITETEGAERHMWGWRSRLVPLEQCLMAWQEVWKPYIQPQSMWVTHFLKTSLVQLINQPRSPTWLEFKSRSTTISVTCPDVAQALPLPGSSPSCQWERVGAPPFLLPQYPAQRTLMVLFTPSKPGQDMLVPSQANDWHLCKKMLSQQACL